MWTRYASHPYTDPMHQGSFRIQTLVYSKYFELEVSKDLLSSLIASFGILADYSQNVAMHYISQYWLKGSSDLADPSTSVDSSSNPLLLYTLDAGDDFILSMESSPLSIFHLRRAAEQFDTSSKPKAERIARDVKKVAEVAKQQFREWCLAFKEYLEDKSNLTFRFIMADPVTFGFALQPGTDHLIRLSQHWTGSPLTFDDAPISSFNIVDVNYNPLEDPNVLDILTSTIPLLQFHPLTTLVINSTNFSDSVETFLMHEWLCGDEDAQYNLLGLAPIAALTQCSTTGLLQNFPYFRGRRTASYPVQVVFKFPWSGDPNVISPLKMTYDFDPMAKILANSFDYMLKLEPPLTFHQREHMPQKPPKPFQRSYLPASFARLAAFFKTRIHLDWDKTLREFTLQWAAGPDALSAQYVFVDYHYQLYLAGVHNMMPGLFSEQQTLPQNARTGKEGAMTMNDRPLNTCVVLRVPRAKLTPLYKKAMLGTAPIAPCSLEMTVGGGLLGGNKFPGFYPLFGKLTLSEDRLVGKIEVDKLGWRGKEDLFVFTYIPTNSLLDEIHGEGPQDVYAKLELFYDRATKEQYGSNYGDLLCIHRAKVLDTTYVHLLKKIEGFELHPPSAVPIQAPGRNSTVIGNLRFDSPHLALDCKKLNITMRAHLLSAMEKQILSSGAAISAEHSAPCTMLISFGNVSHQCPFPFPIIGKQATVRVSRKSGWFEIRVPVQDVARSLDGGYLQNIFPIAGPGSSWNLPAVNFDILKPLADAPRALSQTPAALGRDLSDDEIMDSSANFTKFKSRLTKLMVALAGRVKQGSKPPAITITYENEVQFFLFVTGMFFDDSAHSIVAEAFYMENSPGVKRGNLPLTNMKVSKEELGLWKAMIPAIIERCRTSEHGDMKGVVNSRFKARTEWAIFEPHVVRCALSPLFPAPFIHETKMQTLTLPSQLPDDDDDFIVETGGDDETGTDEEKAANGETGVDGEMLRVRTEAKACRVCGKDGPLKKCGRCENVFYCSIDCQKQDWNRHKTECRRAL